MKSVTAALLGTAAVLMALPAAAQSNPFALGQIELVTVTAQAVQTPMSISTLSSEEMWVNQTPTLDQAVNVLPGVAVANSGGPRNEQLIFVRGFNRFQVPLSIDGIRVYLPADNRLDFARFLTTDLAQVQVAKGYVSVLNGPGAMGGAINLVTRKPSEAFEVEGQAGLTLGHSGALDRTDTALTVGTRQDNFYLQASVSWSYQPRFELSGDFKPTPTQAAGFRDHSQSRDFALNLKAGYTPNATDEYSISYIQQTGQKDAPFAVSDPIYRQRDWTWPYWDISSVYFLSNTRIGKASYLKTRLYYNTFTNGLFSFDNANFNTQTFRKSFRSYYDDYGYGGSIEAGTQLSEADTLKAAFFYRRDNHTQWETIYSPTLFTEPKQTTTEDTYSIAAENTFQATSRLSATAGISYDWRNTLQAQDYIVNPTSAGMGSFVHYPVTDSDALNVQGALIYALGGGKLYANISDRARFPTIFERYSTRFNTAASNPNLRPERAVNYEIGASDNFGMTHVEGALFYSDVSDAIESVFLPAPAPVGTTQSQNVGNGSYYGFEIAADTGLSSALRLGGNYTYTHMKIDTPIAVGAFELTGVPPSQAYLWLGYTPIPALTLTPNLSIASGRWTATTDGSSYYKTGAYTSVGFSADWRITERADALIGAKNLLDSNYELSSGFPEAGRTFFIELRYRQ